MHCTHAGVDCLICEVKHFRWRFRGIQWARYVQLIDGKTWKYNTLHWLWYSYNCYAPRSHEIGKSYILNNPWHYFPLPSRYDVIIIKHFFLHCSKLWIEQYKILSFWGKAFSSYCLNKAWEVNVPTDWYTNQLTDICKAICLSFFFGFAI